MNKPDFRTRSTERELMDADDISFAEFHGCLQSLERINILTFAYRPTLKWLRRIKGKENLKILDVGSGGGDMLRRLARVGRPLTLTGVDLNPWSKKSAELAGGKDAAIRYETADIFSVDTQGTDLIISSLFTHHLDDVQLARFLGWMDKTATRGWFVNDLHRHPLPYYFIKCATKIFSRNRLIRNDAAVSVARAFTTADWFRLLEKAGVPRDRVTVKWFFPFRLCVSCLKP